MFNIRRREHKHNNLYIVIDSGKQYQGLHYHEEVMKQIPSGYTIEMFEHTEYDYHVKGRDKTYKSIELCNHDIVHYLCTVKYDNLYVAMVAKDGCLTFIRLYAIKPTN